MRYNVSVILMEITGKYNTAKVFTDNIDSETYTQILNVCNQPQFADIKLRFMSDVHSGAGCVIGTTHTIKDKIVPFFVGVDICCGVNVTPLGDFKPDLKALDEFIRKNIPSGFNNNPHPKAKYDKVKDLLIFDKLKQTDYNLALGTLGGGNHFIELDKDNDNNYYLVIHSGSRNLGKQVAEIYQDIAVRENHEAKQKAINDVKKSTLDGWGRGERINAISKEHNVPRDLTPLTGDSMKDYLHDMRIMYGYADLNRQTMARRICEEFLGLDYDALEGFTTLHNYVDVDGMILRKGAVSAKLGERLIIPINMRDGALICTGKGNPDWNYSAPHGAGRIMGRRRAKDELKVEDFIQTMNAAGIYSTSVSQSTLDESPMVYKSMDEIIRNIGDTVEITDIIKPVYNFKAGGD